MNWTKELINFLREAEYELEAERRYADADICHQLSVRLAQAAPGFAAPMQPAATPAQGMADPLAGGTSGDGAKVEAALAPIKAQVKKVTNEAARIKAEVDDTAKQVNEYVSVLRWGASMFRKFQRNKQQQAQATQYQPQQQTSLNGVGQAPFDPNRTTGRGRGTNIAPQGRRSQVQPGARAVPTPQGGYGQQPQQGGYPQQGQAPQNPMGGGGGDIVEEFLNWLDDGAGAGGGGNLPQALMNLQ